VKERKTLSGLCSSSSFEYKNQEKWKTTMIIKVFFLSFLRPCAMTVIVRIDSKGNPRCITNSKGRKRRPGSKDLTSILKNCDPVFVNFVSRCLEYVDTVTQCKIMQHNREPSLCSTMHDGSCMQRPTPLLLLLFMFIKINFCFVLFVCLCR